MKIIASLILLLFLAGCNAQPVASGHFEFEGWRCSYFVCGNKPLFLVLSSINETGPIHQGSGHTDTSCRTYSETIGANVVKIEKAGEDFRINNLPFGLERGRVFVFRNSGTKQFHIADIPSIPIAGDNAILEQLGRPVDKIGTDDSPIEAHLKKILESKDLVDVVNDLKNG